VLLVVDYRQTKLAHYNNYWMFPWAEIKIPTVEPAGRKLK